MRARFIAMVIVWAALTGAGLACFQMYPGPTRITASELKGRVTYDRKPLENSRLELHRAINFTKDQVWKEGPRYDPVALKIALTDSDGRFSFGKLAPGKYWIRMTAPSYEAFALEVAAPGRQDTTQQLLIAAYGDWCTDASADPPERPLGLHGLNPW